MASLFYGKSEETFYVSYHKIRATAGYLKHYDIFLTLDFISKETKDRVEKRDALADLIVCERKMAWMRRHPNYDEHEALRGVEELKKKWIRAIPK